MTDAKAHTFTPKDDSLEARASSFRRVLRDVKNAEKSMKLADSPTWSARLGSREEIQSASKIAQSSLEKASRSFNEKELNTAIKRGLLKENEIKEITAQKNRSELQAVRREQHRKSKDYSKDFSRGR